MGKPRKQEGERVKGKERERVVGEKGEYEGWEGTRARG